MTDIQLHQTRTGIQDVALALRGRLQRYIESAYHLRDATLVQERHALLEEPGTIAREPFLETTPSYELSVPYGKLRLPSPIGATLDELASWEPDMGVFPRPYRHQAQALESFFADQRDLIVSTGTGSGKTETFLLPIVGSLLEEAAGRPASFRRPGFRALVLYPMNALVSDQIARLRRWLGDERLSALFRSRYGRHPRFGMYTSRTPYPGLRTSDKDKRYLDTLLKYYIDLENAAQQDKPKAQLINELQKRGRWPAKDLRGFYGVSGGRWESRLLTRASDRELLTRHEMQIRCPDVLVTNYSMLEYMLMRPIEQPIFTQTRDWLASDPKNALILVVDEAHLYRGTAGAEVAYLIRRLQARLGIPRDRMRCILTSASLGPDATVQEDALRFAHDLTGQPTPRSFHLVRGYREPRPPHRPGTQAEAVALAAFDQLALANRAIDGKKLRLAVAPFAQTMGWPAAAADADLPAYLYERLHGLGPIELLIAETTGQATALAKLAAMLFPDAQPDLARRAAEALLSLGTYANNGQRPLLQTRVHMLFRGLPSLWACVNRICAARRIDPQGGALLGRLYTEPRTQCECGARVYELLAHRDCGAVFLRAFGTDAQADFYWHEARGRLDHTSPLHEEWLILEQPHRDQEQKGLVYPIWMDVMTGRVTTDPPEDAQGYRRLWRSGAQEQDQDGEARSEKTHPLKVCPICTRKTPDKIADLATRGERPFANIVHEQFVSQPPSREFSEELPNGGRKVLLFADGRQKAARLARDLPREVEFDTFRQALTIAVDRLQSEGEEVTIGVKLYAAFVSVCHKLRLHFFDQEFGSQAQFLRHLRKFAHEYDAELAEVLYEEAPFGEFPMRYRQHLLDQLANPFYAVYHLGAIVAKPSASAIRRMRRELKALPERIRDQIELIATFWVQELLERGAFDKGIPEHVRERALLYPRPPKHGAALRDLEKVLKQVAALDDGQMQALRTCLYNVLTEQDEQGLAYLRPTDLTLHLAFDSTWHRCSACGSFQHTPLLGHCAVCASQQLDPCPPDDPATAARYNYYREPLREVLRGARPAHLTAEEHTAQLSQRDVGTVYATTEEFELRFQDIALSDEQPPVDVLSCTTTMEVGIDIGSLVAIGLRNVPPQRENYQQRAGRAGRRGSAISTVVTYADSGPHDHFYYQHPEAIIAGDPRRPLLKIDRPALARRHIYAYLLQTFFHMQMEQLAPSAREELRRQRGALFTALGSKVEFFEQDGMLSFATFRRWLEAQMQLPDGAMVAILGWLPNQAVPDEVPAATFVREVALGLIDELESLGRTPTEDEATEQPKQEELLDSLFDAGLLPTYAFPTDLASFYIFKRDGDRVTIKERPQQSKSQALSEYAPGRLLVVNKETYRVGGIHSGNMKAPAKYLFHKPLTVYVFCPECTYVSLDPRRGSERCPICDTELHVSELLDPPGFSPEKGRPVDERDRDQDISYALGAQLPLPVSPDQLEWRQGIWPHLQYAYAENRTFVITNRGLDDDGFVLCESCGAAWPASSAPRDGVHDRPYLIPPQFGSPRCRGPLHDAPIYLGTTFRSDLLLIRAALQPALQYEPGSPWLRDALRTTVEALSLAASRVLDVDPAELSAGYRHLPQDASGTAIFDLYLFDTASGGAGYAAEAGAEIGAILEAALDVVEGCPRQCQRSCTRCLRHYGNRFWHSSLDRRLAAQLLRHLMYGEVPAVASPAEQRNQLAPLRRFLELEGWDIDEEGSPLAVRRGGQTIVIGTYPALLDPNAPELRRRTGGRGGVQLRDYVVERDLPAAYAELRQAVDAR